MGQALISPSVLKWARLRSQLNIDLLAKKVPVKVEKITEWEEGESLPTFVQAQKLAKVLHIPFGYLFLSEPPKEEVLLPDFRTIDDRINEGFSSDLREVISDIMFKQEWYKSFREEEKYEPINFIGKYSGNVNSSIVSSEITETLGLTMGDRKKVRNWEEYYKLLVSRAESLGLWIMKSSIVGNNTRRLLDVEEFRGFVISDKIAPVIFINGADAKSAQIFTLIHEIVHLYFGESGVSNIDFRKDADSIKNKHEKKCNEIAAEVLVPYSIITNEWNYKINLQENAEALSILFKVSSIVVARRALDLDIVSKNEFFDYYEILKERWKSQKQKVKETEGGPSFYTSIPIKNGREFSYDVVNSVYSNRLLMREGARLLGLNPSTLAVYAKKAGVR